MSESTTALNSALEQLAQAQALIRHLREQTSGGEQGEVEGFDTSKTVKVTLSDQGKLSSITVENEWAEAMDRSAEQLGQAVCAAAADATARRMGLRNPPDVAAPTDRDEIESALRNVEPAQADVEVTDEDREAAKKIVQGQVADLEYAAKTMTVEQARENFLNQLERLQQLTTSLPTATPVEYTNETRTITLSFLGGALTQCSINSKWASSMSGNALTMALREVLDQLP